MALITSRNNPRVRNVTGIVRIMSMGFRVTFNKLKTRASIRAEVKLATVTPGSRYPVANTAMEDSSILIKKFKCFVSYSNICF